VIARTYGDNISGSMASHLKEARDAPERPWRAGGNPHADEIFKAMRDAIQAILKHLEELDEKEKAEHL
jgi:hypothetical protein